MGHAGDELSYGSKSLAVKQLFLRPPKVLVSKARLFVKPRALDGTGDLAAHSYEQVHVRWRKLTRRTASHNETANHAILRPQDNDIRGSNSFFHLRIAENRRQRQALRGKERRMDFLDVLEQLRFHGNRRKMPGILRAMTRGRNAPQLGASFIKEIEGCRVKTK